MFVDKVRVLVKSGDGGDGAVSFRHEKFVDHGGPDGGDGGNGGSVIVRATSNQNTLATFRYQKLIRAESGKSGSERKKHGKNGKDLHVDLPVGTVITDSEGNVVADLSLGNQEEILLEGGKGGFGNSHFTSSTRQAPRVAEKGEQVDQREYTFELKMIADVGLVGLPNAGKSTLLSVISNARPEIADYPFTTTTPNLGVVDVEGDSSLLFADIPGLIEGANTGKGLGDEFLRHVERTKVLVHLIDIYDKDIVKSYKIIQNELRSYSIDLTKKQQIIVLNKAEGLDKSVIDESIQKLQKNIKKKTPIIAVSAVANKGIKPMIRLVLDIMNRYVKEENVKKNRAETPIISINDTSHAWNVEKVKGEYVVRGKKIEQFARKTDFDSPYGVQRLREIMRKMGIMHELERSSIKPEQNIKIGSHTIKY